MISRRDVLKALPALAVAPLLLKAEPVSAEIQYSTWAGRYPAEDAENQIDMEWANKFLAGAETEVMDLENVVIIRTRKVAILPEQYAEYFTDGTRNSWRTDYLWHGPVTLVRDIIFRRRDGNISTHCYCCRIDDQSIQGRRLLPEEKPPERWMHIG